ncbi:hypothetical protein Bca101_009015 [Brassica carinata]
MELRLLIQNAIDLQLDTAASENVFPRQRSGSVRYEDAVLLLFFFSTGSSLSQCLMTSRECVTAEAEDDRRRDCLAFLEEKQRQAKKAALRTLLRTSPLLGTRLASLAPISFSFLLGLFRFGLF